MSFKKWTVAALAGATLGLISMLSQPAMADGTRIKDQTGVLWLGSLSTGYVVGTPIDASWQYKVAYMRVPIARMVVVDARNGRELWQGKPYVGQVFSWDATVPAKFIVYSSPETVWPPWNPDPNAAQNIKRERPVLDAVELQMVAIRPLQEPDYWHRNNIGQCETGIDWENNGTQWPPTNTDTQRGNYLPWNDQGIQNNWYP